MADFNDEDLQPHRTVALAASLRPPLPDTSIINRKFLFSINLKHQMITFPIGKCLPNESLLDGLIREMLEELGVDLCGLKSPYHTVKPLVTFTKDYDFTGKNVPVETNVFYFDQLIGSWACEMAYNREPKKCGGIFVATLRDVESMVQMFDLKLADCVTMFPWCATKIEQGANT